MKIKLNEIPEDGRSYVFTRESAELNLALADVIGNESFDIQLFIKPLNMKDFVLTGHIKTRTEESCSRCGDSFKFPLSKKIKEILIPKQELDRTGKYIKSSVAVSEDDHNDAAVVEYSNNQFDFGEYLHEAIAIDVPFAPMPETKPNGDCILCDRPANKSELIYDEKLSVEEKISPFDSLKNIKLN
ncbi:MAG: DUF177 domain-containing protein [Pseudobdellovibrio sp.]